MELPLDLRPQDITPPVERSPRLLDAINAYRRHLLLFVAVAFGVAAVIIAAALMQTPQYTASASLIIAPHKAEVGQDQTLPSDPFNDSVVDSQVEVLKSRFLAEAVINNLHLLTDPAFIAASKGAWPRGAKTAPPKLDEESVIQFMQKHMGVHRVAQTLVIEVSYKAPNPALAANVANAYANAYVDQSAYLKLDDSRTANRLLGGDLDGLRRQVDAADEAVASYKASHNLLDVQGSTIPEQEIVSLDGELASAKAAEAEAVARLNTARQQLQNGSNGDDVGEALSSPVIQSLRSQREEASTKLADLQSTFGPRYPDVISARQQVADIDSQIHAEIRRIVSNLQAQAEVATRRYASLQSSLNAIHGNLAAGNAATVKLNELQLTADSARAQYEAVLNRAKETSTQASIERPDVRITNLASPPPKPSSPKMPIISIIAGLLGVCAGIAAVLLRQELDTGMSTLEDVESALALPYAGALPTLKSSNPKAKLSRVADGVGVYPFSSFAEAYRTLGAFLLHAGSKTPTVIAVSSSLPAEGKTVSSLCLARVLSRMNKRVALVDCDPRRPSVAREAQLSPAVGVLDVLDGRVGLAEALVQDPMSDALILPMLDKGPGSADSPFARPQTDALLAELRKTFDVVILDTAPILPLVDGRLLAQKADVVLLLVRWRQTPEKAARLAVRLLQDLGVQVSGVSLSQVNLKAQVKTGYGDPTYYYRRFKNYYHA